MRTRLAAQTALTCLIALVLTSALVATAPAGGAASRRVEPRDLPSRSEVVHALPGLKGIRLGQVPDQSVRHYAGVCSSWTWTEARSGQARSGDDIWSQRAFDAQVVQFRRKREARAVFASYRSFVRDCGQHWAGVDTTVQRERVPRLGDQRIGYRTTQIPAPETNRAPRHFFTVVVRTGRRLLLLNVQQPAPTRRAQMARLTRVAVDKMG
ncbi:hypothetical protein [Nocardioides daeguensis]|uniref:Sensor domain-containing protein n=1 Tax=Nocardioides daeguensis TaxID=908359 RepID=A0ABP6VK86_9ACTN|nr:hypothetical protein [Nocardioides daeguensis]MBV6728943.1 hypothetical protein [Nocardioides daeguensis]MCR1773464.1 hypothetical protein [Nocardioides daeguensis]